MRGYFSDQKKIEFSKEEFFQIGLGRFFNQDKKNVKKVVNEKLIDFSVKNHMLVDPDFFLKISQLGEKVLSDKLARKVK
jgi:hypothetical protein